MIRLHWSTESVSAPVPENRRASRRPEENLVPGSSGQSGRLAKLEQAEKILHLVWVIVGAAAVFSLLTGGPWAAHFMPKGWGPAGFLLPVIVDVSLVIAVNLTAAATYLGEKPGAWLSTLRWITVIATIFLNVGDSAEKKDLTGVAIHAIIPALLTAATAGEIWFRRKVGEVRAAEIEQAERERVNARQEAREQEERERRERQKREDRERADRLAEAERLAAIEQQRAEQGAAIERAKLEAQERQAEADRRAAIEREKIEAQERQAKAALQAQVEQRERERAEQAAREQRAHELRVAEQQAAAAIERERLAHEAAEAEARRKHELSLARASARAARSPEGAEDRSRAPGQRSRERSGSVHETVHETVHDDAHEPAPEDSGNRERLSPEEAIKIIKNTPNASVRTLAGITGWSVGWISNQRKAVSATANGSNSEEKEE